MARGVVFTDDQLNEMLEEYQGLSNINIILRPTSIHAAGPDMCRQLLRLKRLVRDFIETPEMTTLGLLKEELR